MMKLIHSALLVGIILCLSFVIYIFSSTTCADSKTNYFDNTIKLAVYLPNTNATLYNTSSISYDPLCTAMFFGDNLNYFNDSNIANSLTASDYALLLIPKQEMTNSTADVINKYIANGGSVWFLVDPSYLTDKTTIADKRIDILNNATYSLNNTIANNTTVTINNTDVITNGMPSEFYPETTKSKWYFFRSFKPAAGTVQDFNYNVLMNHGNCAMMVKFENPKTGSRVIYSDRNMFISGGSWNFFDSTLSTKLFQQTKAWLLKLSPNTYGMDITYPHGDKQFTMTLDDEQCATYEIPRIQPFFEMESAHGVDPASVNTFFLVPSNNTTEVAMINYSQYGDVHALHPHNLANWTDNESVAHYTNHINEAEGIIYNVTKVNDFDFTSWRFPSTAFCINSMKAVADSGILIDSSAGRITNSGKIGTYEDNTMFFPKRIVIEGEKTNTIEMEMTSSFDITAANGTAYYEAYANYLPYLKNVNFPSNFIVVGHYQRVGTMANYTSGLGQILDASKNTGTSYSTLYKLGTYIDAVQSANIKAMGSDKAMIVTVNTPKQIDDFTLKLANIKNGVHAQYDGKDVTDIKQDNGVYYLTHTVEIGTHTFNIED